ncbi:hypothetical protein W97_00484 [Coniosporium apollinis CBS 100218]|uniref:Uncharacterized protein n=1 Tax=Coniosporium apollinis (strain CBS 100218) TaxID=1168221 RepID=R7YHZ8_CONA1|nr:uncharacterized protein W97_00484 [Coniosporium apollinis CBS 100218]EON61271.1 hypothetical protein W97_00484 [Coniosporium apollinis CBS 100218]
MSDDVASPYEDTKAYDTAGAGGRDESVGLDVSLTQEGQEVLIPKVIGTAPEDEELTPRASNLDPTNHQLLHVHSCEYSSDHASISIADTQQEGPRSADNVVSNLGDESAALPITGPSASPTECTGVEAAASDETGSADSGRSDSTSEGSSSDGASIDKAESNSSTVKPLEGLPDSGCSNSDSNSKTDSDNDEADSEDTTPRDVVALPVPALSDEAVCNTATLTVPDFHFDNSDSELLSGVKLSEDKVVNKDTVSDDAATLPTSAPPDGFVDEPALSMRSDTSSSISESGSETKTDSAKEEIDPEGSISDSAAVLPAPKAFDAATGKQRSSSSSESSPDDSDSDSDTEPRLKKAKSGSKAATHPRAASPPSFNPNEEVKSLKNKGLSYTKDNHDWFCDFPAAYWVGSIRAGESYERGDTRDKNERPWPMLRMIQRLDPKPDKAGRDLITHIERRESLAGPSRPRSRLDVIKGPEDLKAEAEAEAAAKAAAVAQLKAAKTMRRGSAPAVPERGPPLDQSLLKDFDGFGASASKDNGAEIKGPRPVRPASGRHRPVTWHGGLPSESRFEISPPGHGNNSSPQDIGVTMVPSAAVTVDTVPEWQELWPDRHERLTPSKTPRSPQDEINSLEREKIRAFEKFRDAGQLPEHSSLRKWADPAVRLPVEREWRMELERKLEWELHKCRKERKWRMKLEWELHNCRKALADTVQELNGKTEAHKEANERIAELKRRIKDLEEKLRTAENPPKTELAERIDRLASSILLWFDLNHMVNDPEGRMPTKSEVKDSLASSCTLSDFCQSLLVTGVNFEIHELAEELRDGNISTAPELEALFTAGGKSPQEQVSDLEAQREISQNRIAELEHEVKKIRETVEELTNSDVEHKKLLEFKQAEVEYAKKEQTKRTAAFEIREGALLQQVQRLKEKHDSLARENEAAAELKRDFTLLEQDLRRCESLRAQPSANPAGGSEDVRALSEKCINLEAQLQEAQSELEEAQIKMLDALAERDDATAKWESFTGSEEAVQLGEMYLEIEQLRRSLAYTQQWLEYAREINRDFHGQIEDLRVERGLLLTRISGSTQEERVDEGTQGIFTPSGRFVRPRTKKEMVYERMREERVAETMARLLEWQDKDYDREVRWRRMFGDEMEPSPASPQEESLRLDLLLQNWRRCVAMGGLLARRQSVRNLYNLGVGLWNDVLM